MDPKICAEQWCSTKADVQSSSVRNLPIHPQIPFFQIKLQPQVHRFTMQPPHRWKDEKHSSFERKQIQTKKKPGFLIISCLELDRSDVSSIVVAIWPIPDKQARSRDLSNWFEIDSGVGRRVSIHNHYPSATDWKSTSRDGPLSKLLWKEQTILGKKTR